MASEFNIPTFKECAAQDIKNTFLNPDEFAEEHNLNGTTCLAIVEGLTTKERSARANANYEGIYGSVVIVHVAKAALPEVPVYEQNYLLDGKLYYVASCDDEMGVLTLELRSNNT